MGNAEEEEEEWWTPDIELGMKKKMKNGEPQRSCWGTQKKKNKNGEPQRSSWGRQKKKKDGEPHRYSWEGRRIRRRMVNPIDIAGKVEEEEG